MAAGCESRSSAAVPGHSTAPRPIAGGRFEASGAVFVPGSQVILFVDDGREREVLAMELAPDATQLGQATSVRIDANVTDAEGITTDGTHFYLVGSQSKRTGFDGDGLVRFTFDAGAGIRGLEYDAHTGSFRLITGASLNAENRDFQLMEWDGRAGSMPKVLATYPRWLKPEGITRAMIAGRPVTVIVFDTGLYLVTD